ncbi:copper resistance D family protein [Billgrantia endophytica]|uniref:Copper resistance protein D n=1 Tax=Billgrantia endophytica TaxID=2033802 RepID=A0A2N7U1Y5_9GAMM|nr:CopD family protein [Halomonas endophytica]PMR74454.1 copper resistance protein CopD [Halomonas endophytica]
MNGIALAGLDPWTAGRVLSLAGFYGAALLAVGGVLFRFAFPSLPQRETTVLKRSILLAVWAGIGMLLLLWLLQAAYLGGGNWAAARNPLLLGIAGDGAQGDRLRLAVVGLLLLQANLMEGRFRPLRHGLSMMGIGLVLLAFAQVGHTRGDPRLGGLLVVHLTMAAFWAAALMPLYRLAGRRPGDDSSSRLLAQFGRFGLALVPLLLIAGGCLAAWLLGGRLSALLYTPYGQLLSIKLTLVALLLLLGATNRWWLVPAAVRGAPNASRRLRGSIAAEGLLMALIILVAAGLLTTTSPVG